MEFKCALSHCYIISPLNVRASIYYLLKMQPAGCYKHRILLAVFTHRYGCCILQLELVLASKNCYALQSKDPSAYRFLCVCVCVCVCVFSCSVVSGSLQPHGQQPASPFCSWYFPGKNTGVSCHFLLQRISPTRRSNLCLRCLLHWQADSLPLSKRQKTHLTLVNHPLAKAERKKKGKGFTGSYY